MIVLCEIVIPPDRVFGAKYPPLALACLASALKQAGHPVRIVLFEPGADIEDCVAQVLALRPLVVGFSVFMGYKLQKALQLARAIKKASPDLPVLWGGVHPSILPEQTLQEQAVDWVCIGPGETTITPLADALLAGDGVAGVPGLAWRNEGKVVVNPPGLPRPDTMAARPDWDSFPVEEFIFEARPGDRIIGMVTSRGCPHDCGFCYNAGYHGRKWQPAPLEQIQEEMLGLQARFGINGFLFLDDLFLGNRSRALTLLHWMGAHGLHCQSIDLRLDEVDAEILDALEIAGTRAVFLGVESSVDRVLEIANKRSRKSDLHKAMALFDNHSGMSLWLSCIFGLPTETFSEMKETIREMARIGRRPNTLVNLAAFIPFPNTQLFASSLECGFATPNDMAAWSALAEARGSGLDHFPGRLTRAQTRYVHRAAHYLGMLYHPARSPAGLQLSHAVRCAFSRAAAWRLDHEWLSVPFDLWLYQRLQDLRRAAGDCRRRRP